VFGQDITSEFKHRNGLDLIFRAHQMVMEGYQMSHEEQVTSNTETLKQYWTRNPTSTSSRARDKSILKPQTTLDPKS
jgi:hypothetical protein